MQNKTGKYPIAIPDQSQIDTSTKIAQFGTPIWAEVAQTFTPSKNGKFYGVQFYLNKYNEPIDRVRLEIHIDDGGTPGLLLGTSEQDEIIASIRNSPVYCIFTFGRLGGPRIEAGKVYWMLLKRTGALSGSDFYEIWGSDISAYSRGSFYVQYIDKTWHSLEKDVFFKQYYVH